MKESILVVDDEADYRTILRDTLEDAGYKVELASDGREALESLAKAGQDLVILDWTMADLDGESTCRLLREKAEFNGLPVLLLSVRSGAEDRLEALHFGADDYLAKPFDRAELLTRIRSLLRRGRRAA